MIRVLAFAAIGASLMALAGCQPGSKNPTPGGAGKSAALRTMEQVAIAAHKCWFASKDRDFRAYRMANELNSFSGTPRFLLVPAKDYGGKPLLVVQAQGNSSHVEIFGPLMGEPLGARVGSDISRWKSGDNDCRATG
jgi:hypothetical protein